VSVSVYVCVCECVFVCVCECMWERECVFEKEVMYVCALCVLD